MTDDSTRFESFLHVDLGYFNGLQFTVYRYGTVGVCGTTYMYVCM